MDRDEIIETRTMESVVMEFGYHPTRTGMMCCPFHGERHPSMKIYPRHFKCFACGEYGNVFDFVMKLNNWSFKEAFLYLGGEYKKPKNSNYLERYHKQKEAEMREKKRQRQESEKLELLSKLASLKEDAKNLEPFSDQHCVVLDEILEIEKRLEELEVIGVWKS